MEALPEKLQRFYDKCIVDSPSTSTVVLNVFKRPTILCHQHVFFVDDVLSARLRIVTMYTYRERKRRLNVMSFSYTSVKRGSTFGYCVVRFGLPRS